MASIGEHLYTLAPVWLQHVGVSAFGVVWKRRRFGGVFPEAVKAFESRESNSRGQWHDYQTESLRQLLVHVATYVPHYREVFREAGLTVADLRQFGLDDLPRLPVLEKETIRRTPDRFIAGNVNPGRLHTYLSSGTTGTPLAIRFTADMHRTWSAAYEVRCRRWAGVDYTMRRATIGGRLVVPKGRSRPPFWRHNLSERQLYLSAFHISPSNVPSYVDALDRFKPDYVAGYASSHFFLARMIREMGLRPPPLRAALTSSEKLTPEMRRTIEQAYQCEVFDAYSGVEACCLASECEYHRLHLSPDVGIVELLDDDGRPSGPGEAGEIVATGLLNFAQPLIRYRTGDWAVRSQDGCGCGRQMPVLEELVGRLEDTVVGPDGREMVRFHGIFVGLPHIRSGQVIQEALSQFRVRLVADREFGDDERRTICHRFEERLGAVDVSFDLVDRIEPTERGKFRAVISHVRRRPAGEHADVW